MHSAIPSETLALENLGDASIVDRIVEAGNLDGAGVRFNQIDTESGARGSTVLVPTGPDPQLVFDVDLDAASVHEIVVRGKNLGPRVEVFWAGALQRFSGDRMVSVKAGVGDEAVHLMVGNHSEWSGRISQLRLDPTHVAGHRVRVLAMDAMGLELSRDALADSAQSPSFITLGDETRTGVPSVPGNPLAWNVVCGEGEKLTFGFGAVGGIDGTARIRVSGPSLAQDFETILNAGGSGQGRWHDAEIPCRGARTPSAIEFSATLEAETPLRGTVVWSNPAILREDARDERSNVILISLDTLRPDHLSAYGYHRPTSPQLDRIASDGVVFETVVATAPWTLPSHVSMLSGIGAVRHGINHGTPKFRVPLVSSLLADSGYATVAITAGGYLNPHYGFAAGFDQYHAWPGTAGSEDEMREGMDDLLAWLEDHADERFFAFFHTYEIHSPYRPRAPYFRQWCRAEDRGFDGTVAVHVAGYDAEAGHLGMNAAEVRDNTGTAAPLRDEQLQLLVDCYDAGIAYADAQLARLFDHLETAGLFDETVVVVTSDHGEALGEHGFFDHGRLYDPEILVPLIIRAPGYEASAGSHVSSQVRLVDIVPTMLDLAGVEHDLSLDGISLAPFLRGDQAEVPAEAWSYTPKTNHGVSVRTADGRKLIFNNTAWDPAQGHRQALAVGAAPSDEREAADPAPAHALTPRVVDHLERYQRGLEIEFSNTGAKPIHGTFATSDSQDLIVTRIKGVDIPAGALRVVDARTVAFVVRPGERFTVVAEDLRTEVLELRGRAPGPGQSLTLDLELASASSSSAAVLAQGSWTVAPAPPEEGGTWIRASWRNSGPGSTSARAEDDAQVLEQLRALGYIE